MRNNIFIGKSETIEIAFGRNANSVKFGNQDVLFQKRIKHVFLFHASQIAKTPLRNTVISSSDLAKAFVTFRINGSDEIKRIPATMLNLLANPQNIVAFEGQIIDWNNSEIEFADEITASSILAQVVYE